MQNGAVAISLFMLKCFTFRAGFKVENPCMLFVSVCALLTVSYEFDGFY
jgi:hypothetical protein